MAKCKHSKGDWKHVPKGRCNGWKPAKGADKIRKNRREEVAMMNANPVTKKPFKSTSVW